MFDTFPLRRKPGSKAAGRKARKARKAKAALSGRAESGRAESGRHRRQAWETIGGWRELENLQVRVFPLIFAAEIIFRAGCNPRPAVKSASL